ncbi:MAG: hypothetical protein E6Q78_00375 [Rhodoferax sp.]|nr:MAG: hypothetical protein E6Q78_00375 [Rhodoferax sp.]
MHCEHHSATYHAHRHDQAKAQAHALRREAMSTFWRRVLTIAFGSVRPLSRAVARRRTSLPHLTPGV